MSDKTPHHHHAAARHELAAENHDRAAEFWDGRQDLERAALQRAMAAYERTGAGLERRWAELSKSDPDPGDVRAAGLVVRHTQQGAKKAASLLAALAASLETSAQLADEHAGRCEQEGRSSEAVKERDAAKRAREAAEHARSQAEAWLKLVGERAGQPAASIEEDRQSPAR